MLLLGKPNLYSIIFIAALSAAIGGCSAQNEPISGSFSNTPNPQAQQSTSNNNSSSSNSSSQTLLKIASISPTIGSTAGGTPLNLMGTGFTSGLNTIQIGSTPCSQVNYLSPYRITCVTGASSSTGTQTITLTDSQGQVTTYPPAQSNLSGFFYAIFPSLLSVQTQTCPGVTGITTNQTVICPPEILAGQTASVTLKGFNFDSGSQVILGGLPCTSPVVNTTAVPNTITCTSPALPYAGSYSITVINPDGESITSQALPLNYVYPLNDSRVVFTYPNQGEFDFAMAYSNNQPIPNPSLSPTLNMPQTNLSFLVNVNYASYPSLPPGLTVNSSTGALSGTIPTSVYDKKPYQIIATNNFTQTQANIPISITVSDFGPGSEGSLTLSSGNNSINYYGAILDDTVTNTNSFSVMLPDITPTSTSVPTAFQAGKQILIVQMETSPDPQETTQPQGPTPQWEIATIQSASITSTQNQKATITLTQNINNTYYSGSFNTVENSKGNPYNNSSNSYYAAAQIVSLPSYQDFTIPFTSMLLPGSPWNGQTGGILAFQATGTLTINGIINASAYGFRGGAGINCNNPPQSIQNFNCKAAAGTCN